MATEFIASSVNVGETCIGQMTKLLVVVDSLRAPIALGRSWVSVVGMLSWHSAPVEMDVPEAVAAREEGAVAKPMTAVRQAMLVANGKPRMEASGVG